MYAWASLKFGEFFIFPLLAGPSPCMIPYVVCGDIYSFSACLRRFNVDHASFDTRLRYCSGWILMDMYRRPSLFDFL